MVNLTASPLPAPLHTTVGVGHCQCQQSCRNEPRSTKHAHLGSEEPHPNNRMRTGAHALLVKFGRIFHSCVGAVRCACRTRRVAHCGTWLASVNTVPRCEAAAAAANRKQRHSTHTHIRADIRQRVCCCCCYRVGQKCDDRWVEFMCVPSSCCRQRSVHVDRWKKILRHQL